MFICCIFLLLFGICSFLAVLPSSLLYKEESISVISFLLNFIMFSTKLLGVSVSSHLLLFYFRRLFLTLRILFSLFLLLFAKNSAISSVSIVESILLNQLVSAGVAVCKTTMYTLLLLLQMFFGFQ